MNLNELSEVVRKCVAKAKLMCKDNEELKNLLRNIPIRELSEMASMEYGMNHLELVYWAVNDSNIIELELNEFRKSTQLHCIIQIEFRSDESFRASLIRAEIDGWGCVQCNNEDKLIRLGYTNKEVRKKVVCVSELLDKILERMNERDNDIKINYIKEQDIDRKVDVIEHCGTVITEKVSYYRRRVSAASFGTMYGMGESDLARKIYDGHKSGRI